MGTRKFITRLLYFSIGLAGLIAAGLILFSPSGDVVGNGIITALLILLTDGFILIGLVSRYEWLKVTTWIASLYALIVAVILTWLPNKYNVETYTQNNNRSEYGYDTASNGTLEMLQNLTAGGYIILSALAFACLFSLVSKAVSEKEKVSYYSYVGALGFAILSGVILGMAASWGTEGVVLRLGFSLMFLSFTCAFIMVVSLIVSATKSNKVKHSQMINQPPPYNPYTNYSGADVNNQAGHINQTMPQQNVNPANQQVPTYQNPSQMGNHGQAQLNQPNNGINQNGGVAEQGFNNNPPMSRSPQAGQAPRGYMPHNTSVLSNNSQNIPEKPKNAPNSYNPNSDVPNSNENG